MLNYANLTPKDFEALCRDIMERKLGVALRCFGPGKDGGIDILDEFSESMLSVNPEDGTTHMDASGRIVIQAKHYFNSPASRLISALEDELPKVKRLNPSQYYVCCSNALLPQHVAKIFEIFKDYMADSANIISQNELEKFFSDPANDDILRRHPRLWCSDPNVERMLKTQDVFIDCHFLKKQLPRTADVFVETSAYREARAILESRRLLFITGAPGIGKTTISQMLTAACIAEGCRVRYTTCVTDLAALKQSISADREQKEVILLDDCLGQAYFNMKYTQASELLALIDYIADCPGKYLILNSRITVLNEAKEKSQELTEYLEWNDLPIYQIEVDNISEEDRARILYSHLHRQNLPKAYIDEITKDQRYWNIIRHKNYNPRILKHICNPLHLDNTPPEKYFEYAIDCLNHPNQIWHSEYKERMKEPERILLQTIFSLEYTEREESLVRRCFEKRIQNNPQIDKTLDVFSISLQRLTDSMVSIHIQDGKKYLSFVNPSVTDFIDAVLKESELCRDQIIDSICCPEQVSRMVPDGEVHDYLHSLLYSGEINKFFFKSNKGKAATISAWILRYNLLFEEYHSTLWNTLKSNTMAEAILSLKIKNHDLPFRETWNFYRLDAFFALDDNLYRLLCFNTAPMSFDLIYDDSPITSPWICFPVIEKSMVEMVNYMVPLFHADTKDSFLGQVEHWLYEIKQQFTSLDFTSMATPSHGVIIRQHEIVPLAAPPDNLESFIGPYILKNILESYSFAKSKLPAELSSLPVLTPPTLDQVARLVVYIVNLNRNCIQHPSSDVPDTSPKQECSLDIDALFHSPIDSGDDL